MSSHCTVVNEIPAQSSQSQWVLLPRHNDSISQTAVHRAQPGPTAESLPNWFLTRTTRTLGAQALNARHVSNPTTSQTCRGSTECCQEETDSTSISNRAVPQLCLLCNSLLCYSPRFLYCLKEINKCKKNVSEDMQDNKSRLHKSYFRAALWAFQVLCFVRSPVNPPLSSFQRTVGGKESCTWVWMTGRSTFHSFNDSFIEVQYGELQRHSAQNNLPWCI